MPRKLDPISEVESENTARIPLIDCQLHEAEGVLVPERLPGGHRAEGACIGDVPSAGPQPCVPVQVSDLNSGDQVAVAVCIDHLGKRIRPIVSDQ